MPRGITQEQVNTAADAILQSGERATVERVREQLGTGSPNTITRMLEAWRLDLAERLRAVNATPALPDAVGQAMTQLWQLALECARRQEHQALEAERLALEKARNGWEVKVQEAQQARETAETQAAKDREAVQHASEQIITLQRLIHQLEAQLTGRTQTVQTLQAQIETLHDTGDTLQKQLATLEQRAEAERAAQEAHIRKVEDRAYTQVDQARTDLKAVRADLAQVRKQYEKARSDAASQIKALTQARVHAEGEAHRQRGKAEALAHQLKLNSPSKPSRKKPAKKAKPTKSHDVPR